jgi:hypothetical protein
MKSAEGMLKELVRHVRPRRGCAIVLRERKAGGSTEPNWIASTGILDTQQLRRYNEKLFELRKTDPRIDWSGVQILDSANRRVSVWLPEIDGEQA